MAAGTERPNWRQVWEEQQWTLESAFWKRRASVGCLKPSAVFYSHAF